MYPTSSGLPKSAQASEIALLYLSFSKGDNFSPSNSSTPTLTYWESTNPRKTCCFVLKCVPIATLARVAFLAGERRQGIGYVRQNVEQVAVLGVDDLLHLGHLWAAEAFLRQPFE